jgi:hypothetical protein
MAAMLHRVASQGCQPFKGWQPLRRQTLSGTTLYSQIILNRRLVAASNKKSRKISAGSVKQSTLFEPGISYEVLHSLRRVR